MKPMGLNEIREKYLAFFEAKGHLRLPSFSLVPQDDPSVLLINAGMTPLKPYFTGAKVPPSTRVTTCQKCIRTPDIEQVGYTSRHGTFFEMLGNFSFGDYFKEEIIPWAWEFVTQELKLDPSRLYVTVYHEDDEAYNIWRDVVGLEPERITRLGKEDNFWEHGTGPCGPCSEIFYDRGEEHGCGSETCGVDCSCDRYIEFWNLVFSQFDRQEDGSYLPLQQKNIDTGAGLERIACVVQGVANLFEVDTVRALLDRVCEIAKVTYGEEAKTDVAIRVVTDHIRSTTMMISDGITPANTGRGYVLRRLLRRAARYGRLLGIEGAFLASLAELVIASSCEAYPNLKERERFILQVISAEEEAFDKTIQQGQAVLDDYVEQCKAEGKQTLSGDLVFRLHDTYGFPVDLTREILAEEGLGIDLEGFQAAMNAQKEKGRKATQQLNSSAWGESGLPEQIQQTPATTFLGYQDLEAEGTLLHLLSQNEDGEMVLLDEAVEGMKLVLIFDQTPFYANSGGQVGDRGVMESEDGSLRLSVLDTTKTCDGQFLHQAEVEKGVLRTGMRLKQRVDAVHRLATTRNHTATHLLHKALRDILGDHVCQAGSLNNAERLRFDFRHFQAMTGEELAQVEAEVNRAILANLPVETAVMSLEEAKQSGAMALFDEKYGDRVRVVSIGGDYSKEFCGGTHLKSSAETGLFKLVGESSVASGVRRIEALTGEGAYRYICDSERLLNEAYAETKSSRHDVIDKLSQLNRELKQREKELQQLEAQLASGQADELLAQVEQVAGLPLLVTEVATDSAEGLRDLADKLRDKLPELLLVLGSAHGDKVAFLVMAGSEARQRGVHAGQFVKQVAQLAGGGGGGRPDMAQAGAKQVEKLGEALAFARTSARTLLEG